MNLYGILKTEYNADQTDIFFINIKTQLTEIFRENIGNSFKKYQNFIIYIFTHPSFLSIFLERWGTLLLSEVIK